MSYVIQLHKHIVKFYEDEIDINSFIENVDKYELLGPPHEYEKKCGCYVTIEEKSKHNIFWWLLNQNSRVIKDNNGNKILEIAFGRGRSGHTDSDFRATLKLINLFMKKPKKHVFLMSNEMNDFESVYEVEILFEPHKTIAEQKNLYDVL